MSTMKKAILANIFDEELPKDVIWGAYYDLKVKWKPTKVSILILNAPCSGFGDLIFAMKLASYLKRWYNATIAIATPYLEGLIKLGMSPDEGIKLDPGRIVQCRRFARLKIPSDLPRYDLIFVAPMQADFYPDLADVRKIIPYANKLNTFFFSEYNDFTDKGFDFDTGIGENRLGLLLTDTSSVKGRSDKIKGLYALAYIASPSAVTNANKCLIAFIEMISAKYKHSSFQIIVPPWVDEWIPVLSKKLVKRIDSHYSSIVFRGKDEETVLRQEGGNTLILRGDIFPVQNVEMLKLMKYSVKDILLTGDQSLTDCLSHCPRKTIFYQIAPWKWILGKELAKEMPNENLKRVKTSCGCLECFSCSSDYKNFINHWDFRKLAKPKLDAIVLSAVAIRDDPEIRKIAEMILDSKTIGGVEKRLKIG